MQDSLNIIKLRYLTRRAKSSWAIQPTDLWLEINYIKTSQRRCVCKNSPWLYRCVFFFLRQPFLLRLEFTVQNLIMAAINNKTRIPPHPTTRQRQMKLCRSITNLLSPGFLRKKRRWCRMTGAAEKKRNSVPLSNRDDISLKMLAWAAKYNFE